jgi:hypothetical protein
LHTNETGLVYINDHAVHGDVSRATDKIDRPSTPRAPSPKYARPASPLGGEMMTAARQGESSEASSAKSSTAESASTARSSLSHVAVRPDPRLSVDA